MQNLEWYLADLKSTGKNTIETVEKSLTDMFIRLVRIYPCLNVEKYDMVLSGRPTFYVSIYPLHLVTFTFPSPTPIDLVDFTFCWRFQIVSRV